MSFVERDLKAFFVERVSCGDTSDAATNDSDSVKHGNSPCARIKVSALAIQVCAPSVQDLRDSRLARLALE